jgi:hypothetical protein
MVIAEVFVKTRENLPGPGFYLVGYFNPPPLILDKTTGPSELESSRRPKT